MSEIRQRALELALDKVKNEGTYVTPKTVVDTAKTFENYLRYGEDLDG